MQQNIFINAFSIENHNTAAIWISLKNVSLEMKKQQQQQSFNLLAHINYINDQSTLCSAQKNHSSWSSRDFQAKLFRWLW